MASIGQRIRDLFNGPQGRRLMDRGRHELRKPGNQQKLRRLADRFTGRSGKR